MIIITSHTQAVNNLQLSAILRKLELNLRNYNKEFKTLSHCMNVPQKSFLYTSWSDNTKKVWLKINFAVFRYIYEIILNVLLIRSEYKKNASLTYIWIDPLNAFSWVIAKKLWYIEKSIFYTPDYSPQKFNNKLLNKIYHWIDVFCIKHSDEVWNVSTRIYQIRKEKGVEDERNFFLPNVPWNIKTVINSEEKEQYSLIISWTLNIHLDYKPLIDSIDLLKSDFPKIKLYIAWDWPLKNEIIEYIENKWLWGSVVLLWFLEVSEYLQKVSQCWIWVAMYNGKWAFNYYGDSTKCREFMYFWLPILTTSFHSTADEIQQNKAWIIDDTWDKKSYTKSIKIILKNYKTFSKLSLELWEKNNKLYTEKIWNL